ncbi:hypothetical protein [Pseudobutyrivibrio sp.]
MNQFNEIELMEVNGGGLVSAAAGGLAGGIIGFHAGLIPYAATGDTSYLTKSTIAGATTGVWAGLGCPIP